jgi:hypothetical protein
MTLKRSAYVSRIHIGMFTAAGESVRKEGKKVLEPFKPLAYIVWWI